MALKELDALPTRDPTAAMSFLASLAPMLADDAPDELRTCFDDRAIKLVRGPARRTPSDASSSEREREAR